MARRQSPESLKGGCRARDITIGQILGHARQIGSPLDLGVLKDGLRLRRESESVRVLLITEGLFPQSISGKEELPSRTVPDGEGEHPSEESQTVSPVLFIQVEDDLGVAVGAEPVPTAQ